MGFRKLSSIETNEEFCTIGWYQDFGRSSSAHALLQDDVLDRVTYDDPSVLTRLRVHDENTSAVDECHKCLHVEQADNFNKLLGLVRTAPARNDDEDDEERRLRREEEGFVIVDMKDSLIPICSHLTDFGPPDGVRRRFFNSQSKAYECSGQPPEPAAAAYTPELLDYAPDLLLLDEDSTKPFWERYAGLAVVRPDPADGDVDLALQSAILQCVDYARIHLAYRHFWMFTVALLIIGPDFWVMILDHAGVSLSPAHSIVSDPRYGTGDCDTTMFVRVVRALTRNLSDNGLGQDPTVIPVPQRKFKKFVRRSSISGEVREQLLHEDRGSFPNYLVSICSAAAERRTWCTVGPPIWVSESLLGRGTNVWRAIEVVRPKKKRMFSGQVYVLKSSWRDPRQPLPEAEVYKRIDTFEDRPPSIPALLCGGDMLYEDGPELKVLDTAAVRGGSWMDDKPAKILHRLVLSTVGEPLWKYTDELQLLRAFHAIIEAHRWLAERGILHCDISPGNLLLASGPSAGVSGIVTDFDGAYIDEELFNRVAHDGRVGPMQTNLRWQPVSYTESSLSGTRQFMATHLLHAVERKGTAEHTAAHDLESIGYVFGYTVMRRLLTIIDCPKKFRRRFERAFGGMTVQDIMDSRHGSPLSWIYKWYHSYNTTFIDPHVSGAVLHVLASVSDAIGRVHRAEDDRRYRAFMASRGVKLEDSQDCSSCTHAVFLAALDQGIKWLEDIPSQVKTFSPP